MEIGNFKIAESGLNTSRTALDFIAQNLVNIKSSGYKGKIPILKNSSNSFENELNDVYIRESTKDKHHRNNVGSDDYEGNFQNYGVHIDKVIEDQTPTNLKYDPENPLANEEGYVEESNVDLTKEMVNMIEYRKQHNIAVECFNQEKSMVNIALEIGRK